MCTTRMLRRRVSWGLILVMIALCSWLGTVAHNSQLAAQHALRSIRHHEEVKAAWQAALDRLGTAVTMIDGDSGRIVDWNLDVANLLGWSSGEALGQDFAVLLPEWTREKHRAYLRDPAVREKLLTGMLNVRGSVLCKSGEEKLVEVRITGVHPPGEPYVYVVQLTPAEAILDMHESVKTNQP